MYTATDKVHEDTPTLHVAQHSPTKLQVAVKLIDVENLHHKFSYVQKEALLTRQLQYKAVLQLYCGQSCLLWAMVLVVT